jgi:K+-transporting ATPase ATPase A chain
MIEFVTVLGLALVLGWPLGRYLAAVMRGEPMRGDRLFGWFERPLYRLLGVDPARGMGWKAYVGAFLLSNLVLGLLAMGIFMTQAWLPLNPNDAPNMRWDLALHTAVSFLTNTNQQHYSGQAQLSYLAQMTGIVGLQVITPWWWPRCAVCSAGARRRWRTRRTRASRTRVPWTWATTGPT